MGGGGGGAEFEDNNNVGVVVMVVVRVNRLYKAIIQIQSLNDGWIFP